MICPNCKKENTNNSKWCCYCGALLDKEPAEQELFAVQNRQDPAPAPSTPGLQSQDAGGNKGKKNGRSERKPARRKKRGHALLWILSIIMLLSLAFAACLLLIPSFQNTVLEHLPLGKRIREVSADTSIFSQKNVSAIQTVNDTLLQMRTSDTFVQSSQAEQMAMALKTIEGLADQGLIDKESIFQDVENSMITYTFSNGIIACEEIVDPNSELDDSSFSPLTGDPVGDHAAAGRDSDQVFADGLILCAMSDRDYVIKRCREFSDFWTSRGLRTELDTDVTLDDLTRLSDYEFIYFKMHGSYIKYKYKRDLMGYEALVAPIIALEQKFDYSAAGTYAEKYGEDFAKHNIGIRNGCFFITPGFINSHYKSGDFAGDIFFFGCCELMGKNGDVSEAWTYALQNQSLAAFVGFHNVNSTWYNMHFVDGFAESLLNGMSVREAFDSAVETYGENDKAAANEDKNQPGTPMLRGNGDAKLKGSLETTSAANPSTQWSELYRAFVLDQNVVYEDYGSKLMEGKTFTVGGQQFFKSKFTEPKFGLYDMDRDGTPELIIFNGADGLAGAFDYVFTCDQGQVRCVGKIGFRGCEIYAVDDTAYPGLFCTDGNNGVVRTEYYELRSGAISATELARPNAFVRNLHFYVIDEIRAMGWESFVRAALSGNADYETVDPEAQTAPAAAQQGTIIPMEAGVQYSANIFLSNFSEQHAFETTDFDVNHYDAKRLIGFVYLYCTINRYTALSYEGNYITFTLDTVNDVLNRHFGITLTDQQVQDLPWDSQYYYADGKFYHFGSAGEAYNRLTVVRQMEQLDDGTFRLYFDIYKLDIMVYNQDGRAVNPDYYYRTSDAAQADPTLTWDGAGIAVVRPYVHDGIPTMQLVRYTMQKEDSEEKVISYGGYSTQFGPNELSISAKKGVYNKNMALLCAMLSDAAYSDGGDQLAYLYREMFDGNYCDLNFDYSDRHFCSGIALGEKVINGGWTNVLVITVRGTQARFDISSLDVDLSEIFADLDQSKTKYKDYQAYNSIVNFERKVLSQVSALIGNNLTKMDMSRPMKIIVTGHSLGGAAANLIGATYTNSIISGLGNWSYSLTPEDIYCYTFAPINALDSADSSIKFPISDGYENIHNILNVYDPMVPISDVSRIHGFSDGLFGHNDWIRKDYRDNMFNLLENHQMYRYIESVAKNLVSEY